MLLLISLHVVHSVCFVISKMFVFTIEETMDVHFLDNDHSSGQGDVPSCLLCICRDFRAAWLRSGLFGMQNPHFFEIT